MWFLVKQDDVEYHGPLKGYKTKEELEDSLDGFDVEDLRNTVVIEGKMHTIKLSIVEVEDNSGR